MLCFILAASVLMRFSWDIVPQMLVHGMVLFLLAYAVITRLRLTAGAGMVFLLVPASAALSFIGNENWAQMRNSAWVLTDASCCALAAGMLARGARERIAELVTLIGGFLSVVVITYAVLHGGDFPVDVLINRNVAASYLILALPLALWSAERTPGRLTAAMIFGVYSAALALLWSRAAVVVGILSVLMWLRLNHRLTKRMMVLCLVSACIFTALIMRDKMHTASFSERIVWSKAGVRMFAARPLAGVGSGNYEARYLNFRPELTRNSGYAHNLPVQIIAETGLVGFIVFCVLLWFIASRLRVSAASEPLSRAIACSLGGFLAFDLLNYGFFIPAHQIAFFTLAGIAAADPGRETNASPRFPVMTSVVLIAFIGGAGKVAFDIAHANIRAAQSRYALYANSAQDSASLVKEAIRLDRRNADYHSLAADIAMASYNSTTDRAYLPIAESHLQASARLNPYRARTWFDLYWVYRLNGDELKATAAVAGALARDPFNQKYRYLTSGIAP